MIFVDGYNKEGNMVGHYIAEDGVTELSALIEQMKTEALDPVTFFVTVQDCQ